MLNPLRYHGLDDVSLCFVLVISWIDLDHQFFIERIGLHFFSYCVAA